MIDSFIDILPCFDKGFYYFQKKRTLKSVDQLFCRALIKTSTIFKRNVP